jgi:tetratricopeptide (TPR) repeat protein
MTEAIATSPSESAERTVGRAGHSPIAPEAVRDQLERILNSKAFARSPRISRFLTFVVDQTLDGQESKLKEYLLGVEVFGRMDSFDPRIDSIVRVEARRLRYKLEKYYEIEGQSDPIFIQFRKGCYVPAFSEKRPDIVGGGEIGDVPYVRTIENPHAFALYARGRQSLVRWTADGVAEAVSCLTHALDEDGDCASAHSGLGTAWMFAAMLGLMPGRDVMPKAKNSALRALAIAPSVSEAHAVLGIAAALYDGEWAEAELKLRKAIQVNPCDTAARLWYGLYLTLAGKAQDAVPQAKKVQQAEPTSVTAHLVAGFACHAAGAHDEALMQYRLAQDLDPGFYGSHLAMGLLFADQKMYEQASHALNRAGQLSPRNPAVLGATAYSHAAAGRQEACEKSLAELAEMGEKQFACPVLQAMALSASGNLDAAYRKLEQAAEERSPWLPMVRIAPAFEAVRNHPRYSSFLEQNGLKPLA